MGEGQGRCGPHQIQIIPGFVIPRFQAVDPRFPHVDFRPDKSIGNPFPSLGDLAFRAFHEITVDVRSGLRRLPIIGVGENECLLTDGCSYLVDQSQPAGIVRPPIEHHAIDRPRIHRRLGLSRHLAAQLGVVKVETEVATNDRHSLASPAFRLSAYPHDAGLTRNWWVIAASAGGL
jgi:hypothetical protein